MASKRRNGTRFHLAPALGHVAVRLQNEPDTSGVLSLYGVTQGPVVGSEGSVASNPGQETTGKRG